MYVYGPVPSRRLGASLGVSPIPSKTCSYTCVYCQLGRTNKLTVDRESYFPREEILAQIVERGNQTEYDYVTFVGDGEPTLCADLGWLIRQTAEELKGPTAVITNGSLLFREDVRQDLVDADVVMPTLDAGNANTFRAINRPHRSITYELLLQGLIDFRRHYNGQLWLEVMLVRDLNDSEYELQLIKAAADRISPDRIYIAVPIRPPAEAWVKPPLPETVLRAQEILGGVATTAAPEHGSFGVAEFHSVFEAIRELALRHPLRWEQARKIEEHFRQSGAIEKLVREGKIAVREFGGQRFIVSREASYGGKPARD